MQCVHCWHRALYIVWCFVTIGDDIGDARSVGRIGGWEGEEAAALGVELRPLARTQPVRAEPKLKTQCKEKKRSEYNAQTSEAKHEQSVCTASLTRKDPSDAPASSISAIGS